MTDTVPCQHCVSTQGMFSLPPANITQDLVAFSNEKENQEAYNYKKPLQGMNSDIKTGKRLQRLLEQN